MEFRIQSEGQVARKPGLPHPGGSAAGKYPVCEVKAKIEELREEGIIIIDKPYQAKDFSQYGIEPDVVLPENMDYAHRCVLEATGRKDIYFLTNQEDKERQITATFRTRTSKIRQIVKLSLPAYGSAFVILSNKEDMQVISQTGHKLVEEEGAGFTEKLSFCAGCSR